MERGGPLAGSATLRASHLATGLAGELERQQASQLSAYLVR